MANLIGWSVVCFIYQSRVSCGRRLSRLRVVMWHVSVYPLPTKAQALGCSVSDSVLCSSAPDVGHQLVALRAMKKARFLSESGL